MWAAIIPTLTSVFGTWWKGRQEVKAAKIQAQVARYESEKQFQMKLAEIEATWDLVALRMSQYSTKDEWISFLFFAPLLVAWFPQLRGYTQDWLTFLNGLPYWYQTIMFGIVASTFGLRWWFNKQSLKAPSAA